MALYKLSARDLSNNRWGRPRAPTVFFLIVLLSAATLFLSLLYAPLPLIVPTSSIATEQAAERHIAHFLAHRLPETTHVAYAKVLDTQSEWNRAGTKIVSKHRLALLYPLFGHLAEEIYIETEGGYLADEGIGLWVSHDAELKRGEPLLLLLTAEQEHYRVAGGEQGVFTIEDGQIANTNRQLRLPVETFVKQLNLALTQEGRQTSAATTELLTAPEMPNSAEVMPSDDDPPDDDLPRWILSSVELAIKVNLNSTQIHEPDKPRGAFHVAITRALRTWSAVESADFTLLYAGETDATETGYNGENEILFAAKGRNRPLGQAQIWYTAANVILEVDLWINDNYELNVGDQPAFGEIDLESVVLHELGHWVPMEHASNADAVMYSVLGPQQLKRELNEFDIENLTAFYPCLIMPCIHPNYTVELTTPTSTPTPDPLTPTVTPDPLTPTATPTLVLTDVPPTPTLVLTEMPTYPIYLPFVTR